MAAVAGELLDVEEMVALEAIAEETAAEKEVIALGAPVVVVVEEGFEAVLLVLM